MRVPSRRLVGNLLSASANLAIWSLSEGESAPQPLHSTGFPVLKPILGRSDLVGMPPSVEHGPEEGGRDDQSHPDRTRANWTRGELGSEQGKTTIADAVVEKIAGVAAREEPGVFQLGGGTARAVGALPEHIPGSGGPSATQGVQVEVGEKEAAVDLQIVVDYGVSIADLAQGLRPTSSTGSSR